MHLITDNLQKIIALCKKYKVKSLYVFGSILTPRFSENSDVDFSATFHPEKIHWLRERIEFSFTSVCRS